MGSESSTLVFVGGYTGARSKGIHVCRFDPRTGRLSAPELAAETKNPSFLALHPDGRVLYAVDELSDANGKRGGAVSAFRLDRTTGRLTFLNRQSSCGAGPCHLSVDATGKWVLVANYGSGSIAALPIQPDGSLGAAAVAIQHHGSSVNPQRQAGPHAHFITPDPKNRFALACDLGLDKVLVYRLDREKGLLETDAPPALAIKPGSGPRHLAFHPNGRFAYVINEMGSTLTACSYDARRGVLKEVETVSTLPETFGGASSCAEVAVHSSGKFVYGSNRGHDSIVVYAVDSKSGKLTCVAHQSTLGKTPRHFALTPDSKWLLVENQDSNNLVVFAVDPKTGKLSPTGEPVEVGSPTCAVFLGVK